MSESYLQGLVVSRCAELGTAPAAAFFDVSPALVRQWVNGSKSPSLAAVEKVFALPPSAPADASWDTKDTYLCLPSYKTTNPRTLASILGLWDRSKMGAIIRMDVGLVHVREKIADDYLSVDKPYSAWIDDDMIFPMGQPAIFNYHTGMNLAPEFAGVHSIDRLRSRGKSLVSALYFERHRHGRACYAAAMRRTPEGDAENTYAHTPRNEVRDAGGWAGLGLSFIARQVFLDIKERNPHLAGRPGEPFHFFSNASDPIMQALPEVYRKIEAIRGELSLGEAGRAGVVLADIVSQLQAAEKETAVSYPAHTTEDVLFGRRAAAAGHPTFVDLSVVCGHLGSEVFGPSNTR